MVPKFDNSSIDSFLEHAVPKQKKSSRSSRGDCVRDDVRFTLFRRNRDGFDVFVFDHDTLVLDLDVRLHFTDKEGHNKSGHRHPCRHDEGMVDAVDRGLLGNFRHFDLIGGIDAARGDELRSMGLGRIGHKGHEQSGADGAGHVTERLRHGRTVRVQTLGKLIHPCGLDRHHQHRHAEAADRVEQNERGIRRINGKLAEFVSRHGHDQQAYNGKPAGTDFIENNTGNRGHDPHQNRARKKQKSGFERRKSADVLQIEREKNHPGEHGHRHNDVNDGRKGIHVEFEHTEFQNRLLGHQLTPDEQDERNGADRQASHDNRAVPSVFTRVTEAVEQPPETKGGENNAENIKARLGCARHVFKRYGSEDQGKSGKRDNDIEQGAPAVMLHNPAGQRRTDGRGENHGDAHHAHRFAALLHREDRQEDDRHQRHKHACACRLDKTAGQQQLEPGGESAYDRAQRKQADRGDKQLPRRKTFDQKGADRDENAADQHIAVGQPLDGILAYLEILHHARQGDVEEGLAEQGDERSDQQGGHNRPPLKLGCFCTHGFLHLSLSVKSLGFVY